jgi:hypothetical protein
VAGGRGATDTSGYLGGIQFWSKLQTCELFLYHENLGSQISMRKKKFLTHFRVLELILGIPKKKRARVKYAHRKYLINAISPK